MGVTSRHSIPIRLLAAGVGLLGCSPLAAEAAVLTFQEGAGGYVGTQDTEIRSGNPASSFGSATSISIDLINVGHGQGLIRFDSLFGTGAGQIPPGALINSATLRVTVIDVAGAGVQVTLHRMQVAWTESSTWNSLVNGIQFDGSDALATVDATVPDPTVLGNQTWSGVNLTATVQAWSDGATNLGWGIETNSTDGWDFRSSENAVTTERPLLTVVYTPRYRITGNVFEDANYGGGAGRDSATASGVGRPGARIEIYGGAGAFLASTTTDPTGRYTFNALVAGSYTVRAANDSVTSKRAGYLPGL